MSEIIKIENLKIELEKITAGMSAAQLSYLIEFAKYFCGNCENFAKNE